MAKEKREERREERESRVNDKREDKQDFKLDKLDAKNDKIHAQAVKAEAVSKKRKWLVFLIAAVMAAAAFFKKYIFCGKNPAGTEHGYRAPTLEHRTFMMAR